MSENRTNPAGEPAPSGSVLDDVETAFISARGVPADAEWATTALGTLMIRADASPSATRRALVEVADLVATSGESPDELYGPPAEWAREQVATWREEGTAFVSDPEPASPRDVVTISAVVACVITVMLLIVMTVKGEWQVDYTVGILTFPFTGALTTMIGQSVWERVLRRHSLPVAALAGGAVFAVGIALITSVFMLGNPYPVAHGSVWWLLALAAGYALLAALTARLPGSGVRRGARPVGDDQADGDAWLRQVAGILRLEAAMPEARVQTILAEATAHADETGHSLREEFGNPRAYAARFLPDTTNRARRTAWWWTGILVLMGVLVFGDLPATGWDVSTLSGWSVAGFTIVLVTTLAGWWRILRGSDSRP